jgi:hypothetical protein
MHGQPGEADRWHILTSTSPLQLLRQERKRGKEQKLKVKKVMENGNADGTTP